MFLDDLDDDFEEEDDIFDPSEPKHGQYMDLHGTFQPDTSDLLELDLDAPSSSAESYLYDLGVGDDVQKIYDNQVVDYWLSHGWYVDTYGPPEDFEEDIDEDFDEDTFDDDLDDMPF